jgi:hypothetical protein
MRMYREWRYSSMVLGEGEWSASFPGEKAPWYPFDRRLSGPQRLSGHGGKKKKIPDPVGKHLSDRAESLVTKLTELSIPSKRG